MKGQIALVLLAIICNVHQDLLPNFQLFQIGPHDSATSGGQPHRHGTGTLLAEAKGVAGLGKAGGDGQGGSDKAGQQVPPEVYKALTYAGSLFLLTLSVPLILYGLNKLLNKIEDCFGCGPSSAKPSKPPKKLPGEKSKDSTVSEKQPAIQDKQPAARGQQVHQNQKLHLQLMHQQPKCYNFTPLQEFDDNAQMDNNNKPRHVDQAQRQRQFQSSSPMQAPSSCAINMAPNDPASTMNKESDNGWRASPRAEQPGTAKSLPFSQQQPFIISSPHL